MRRHRRVAVTAALVRAAVHDELHPPFGDERGGRLPERDVDVLSLSRATARDQSGENAHRGGDAAGRITV